MGLQDHLRQIRENAEYTANTAATDFETTIPADAPAPPLEVPPAQAAPAGPGAVPFPAQPEQIPFPDEPNTSGVIGGRGGAESPLATIGRILGGIRSPMGAPAQRSGPIPVQMLPRPPMGQTQAPMPVQQPQTGFRLQFRGG